MANSNPNEILAAQIGKELVDAGLITEASTKKVVQNLAQGTMKESDWKVFLEEVINKPKTAPNENK